MPFQEMADRFRVELEATEQGRAAEIEQDVLF
jgi:hypothetical protein